MIRRRLIASCYILHSIEEWFFSLETISHGSDRPAVQGVGEPFRPLPLAFDVDLSERPNFAKRTNVRSGAGTHVHLVANSNDAHLLDRCWNHVDVRTLCTDLIDEGLTILHVHAEREVFGNGGIKRGTKRHDLIFGHRDGAEVETGTFRADLIAHRSGAVEQIVGKATEEVLCGVHPHVRMPPFPVDGPRDLIPHLEVVVFGKSVVHGIASANIADRKRSGWTLEMSNVARLATAGR